jgi:hypothetical protein
MLVERKRFLRFNYRGKIQSKFEVRSIQKRYIKNKYLKGNFLNTKEKFKKFILFHI